MALLALRASKIQRLIQRVQRPWARYAERRALDRYRVLAGQLLTQLAQSGRLEPSAASLQVTSALITRSDVVVLLLASDANHAPTIVLKLPRTPDAQQSTLQHRQVLADLQSQPALQAFAALLPRPLAWGTFEGHAYYVETALHGQTASSVVRHHAELPAFGQAALAAIRQLHLATLQRRAIDAAGFAELAGNDLAALYQFCERWPEPPLCRERLQAIEALLRRQLIGPELPFSWCHGDFWPGNLLVLPDGTLGGIVDWDRAQPNQLPLLDLLHLLAYTYKMQQRIELGETLVRYLLPAEFAPAERHQVDQALAAYQLPAGADFWRAAVLLYWLRFTAANLSRYPRLRDDAFWLSKNVLTVLKRGLA